MANFVRRTIDAGMRKLGYVPKATMEGAIRERRDRESHAAQVIAHEVLPELAKSLSERGDAAHRKYVTLVQALERLG